MNWGITVIDGKEYTDEQKQEFIKQICGTCAQNCARGCHCLENRVMPCSFYVNEQIYTRHPKSGIPYKKDTETVVHDGEKWCVIQIKKTKTHPRVLKGLKLVAETYESEVDPIRRITI